MLAHGHQSRSLKKDKQLEKKENEEEEEGKGIRKVTPRTIKLNRDCFCLKYFKISQLFVSYYRFSSHFVKT